MPLGKILFPPFDISSVDLGLLVAGNGMFIIALTIAQALIALHGHKAAAVAWGVGVVVVLRRRRRRSPSSTCGSSSASSPGPSPRPRSWAGRSTSACAAASTEGIGSLITQIEHEPLEL